MTLMHYIGGAETAGTSGRQQDVFNPATGAAITAVPLASAAEVGNAVAAAAAALPGWASTPPARRAQVMFNLRDLIKSNLDELATLISSQHGKTFDDAKGEIARGIEVVEFACGIPHALKGEYSPQVAGNVDSFSMRQPVGVVAGITPFNFPAMVPMWMFPMALACGNTFVLKPSERDPGAPMMLARLLSEAGLPEGCFNVVHGDKEAVDAILDHPDVAAISFVGSTAIGKYIYSRGCANGKRVQCFGGAKNHMIIMPDADMDQAADALIGAGYGAAGERCMAISVAVPVGEEAANALMERLVPRVEALKIGPYTAGDDVDFGPLVTAQARERVLGFVEQGVKEGATLAVDGRNFTMQGYENGYFMGGCLFDNVTRDMSIYKEEIFGPVLSQVRAGSYDEEIGRAHV